MKIFTEFEQIKLSINEKDILKFIEDNPEDFVKYGIKQLSEKIFISTGSISRFSKKMGFESFRELKSFVIKENLRYESYYKLKHNDKEKSLIHNVMVYNRHTIEKTIDALNTTDIKQAVKDIEESSKVVTYGLGSSALGASELTSNLNINGINSIFAPSIHDVVLWLKKKMDKKIVVVIFSKEMLSKDNNFLLNLLVKYKVKVILVTESVKFKNQKNLIVINIKTLEQVGDETQISSKISQLFISDVILESIKKHRNTENTDLYKEFHKEWKS